MKRVPHSQALELAADRKVSAGWVVHTLGQRLVVHWGEEQQRNRDAGHLCSRPQVRLDEQNQVY